MKINRLSPVDARIWRDNKLVLLDKEGKFVRYVSSGECKVFSDLGKKVKHARPVAPMSSSLIENGKTVKLTVVPTLIKRNVVLTQHIDDDLTVMTGREFFKTQVLLYHGECQLRTHTGQFICTIRDPSKPRSMRGGNRAPHPDVCQCKPWGESHEGRHHKICTWNASAPLDQQAVESDSIGAVVATHGPVVSAGKPSLLSGPSTKVVTHAAPPAPKAQPPKTLLRAPDSTTEMMATPAAAPPPPRFFAPTDCPNGCLHWVKTEGSIDGEHHPLCMHKDAWEASKLEAGSAGASGPMFLVNLATREVSRQASLEEIEEASGEKGFITIGSDQYGVVPESEIKVRRTA
jgi:hypothetical protein